MRIRWIWFLTVQIFWVTPTFADWHWYAGDLRYYSSQQISRKLPARILEATDNDLDWCVFYGLHQEGFFIGLPEFIREEKLNDPRQFTPILSTQWIPQPATSLICLGLDPRSPTPHSQFNRLPASMDAQQGLAIFENPANLPVVISLFENNPIGFIGLSESGWHGACTPGGLWDSLLVTGQPVVLLSKGKPKARTYVWAESTKPGHLIEALRKGASYVAEADGIHIDVQVENRPLGAHASTRGDAFIRLHATSLHPISQVQIIADGELIWAAQPRVTHWDSRILIPVFGKRYLRFVFESQQGGYKTLSNPIYLSSEMDTGEMPIIHQDRVSPIQYVMESAIESLGALPESAQKHILGEYLRDPGLGYATALALENREDIVSETILWDLAQHADPEVRLGATFALVVRDGFSLSNLLFSQLEDSHLSVRTYAARMIFQYANVLDQSRLIPPVKQNYAEINNYLIRALSPTTSDMDIISYLIALANSTQSDVSGAAADKLVEMGNRDFHTIMALRDSALMGNVMAVNILGYIGDPRMLDDLKQIFQNASTGPLKRASFLALQKQGIDYPNRPAIQAAYLTVSPTIDGTILPDEWALAPVLSPFVNDIDGSSPLGDMNVHMAYNDMYLFIAFEVNHLNVLKPHQKSLKIEWTLVAPEAQPVRFAISFPPTEQPITRRKDRLMEIAQTVSPNRWISECRIPLTVLNIDPTMEIPPFRLNMNFLTSTQRWIWTPTYGEPENSSRYGNLIFAPTGP